MDDGGVIVSAMDTVMTILHIVISIALIVAVLSQQGKDAGLSGAISGGNADTFFGKNKSRSRNGILSKLTVLLAVIFALTTFYLSGIITKLITLIGNLFS